jgi:cobaltochelatase CobS
VVRHFIGPHPSRCDTAGCKCVGFTPFDAPEPAPIVAPPAPGIIAPPAPAPVDEVSIRRTVRSEMVQVLDEYGIAPPPQVIEVHADEVRKVDGPAHAQVPELIRLLGRGVNLYLYGPAGGGKTHAACQALEVTVGKAAVVTMPGITAGKLFGFTDAGGRFVRTVFVDAYEHGGGIVLDELDRALPQVASALNSVLENRRATFNGAEVPMHANFRLVATGNTDMRGGNRTYTGAQPLDLATAARFRFVRWTYDEALEAALVGRVIPKAAAAALLRWARKMRAQLEQDRHDTVFCGPRETMRMAADLATGESMEDAAHGWVFRGLDANTVARLLAVCPLPTIEQVRG